MEILLIGGHGRDRLPPRPGGAEPRPGGDSRDPLRLGRSPARAPGPDPLVLDASVPGKVAEAAAGHDAVVSALSPRRDGSDPTAPLPAVCRSDRIPTFARLIGSTYRPDARCTVTSR